jgi:hypothetical protein
MAFCIFEGPPCLHAFGRRFFYREQALCCSEKLTTGAQRRVAATVTGRYSLLRLRTFEVLVVRLRFGQQRFFFGAGKCVAKTSSAAHER